MWPATFRFFAREAVCQTPAMEVRVARQTARLAAVVDFYRDLLGLEEIGRFEDHDGYDGVMLALAGTRMHLEFTATSHLAPPLPHPETLLVLYFGSQAAVDRVLVRLKARTVSAQNPYWDRHAVTIEDPDGFRVVISAERWES
jgi:catechol 2,3-dioxygenase-like lactoylglutathione lyase family enzyme